MDNLIYYYGLNIIYNNRLNYLKLMADEFRRNESALLPFERLKNL